MIALRFISATSWKLEVFAVERDAYSTFDKMQSFKEHLFTDEFMIVQLCRLQRTMVLPSPLRVLLLACDSSIAVAFVYIFLSR